jgi:uncharacterized membrane protein YgdD (TMEM256/DUF423 family)
MLGLISALSGALAIGLGAFGAHALSDRFGPAGSGWWETATLYLMIHSAVALILSFQTEAFQLPGFVLLCGALLFAATLYAMALGAPTWLGAITPLGGLAMLGGWVWVGLSTLQR